MEFDFLPKLPKSNLDDRRYQDLVEECILRIPRYCPEWTNHNAADPGITLIEMFAWLTDQMLLRFNQVPRRNYITFLELLGIRLQPPAPAHTDITFYLTRAQSAEEHIPDIPEGTEVATERTESQEAIVFSTNHDLPIGVPRLCYFLTADTADTQEEHRQDFHNHFSQWNQDEDGRWWGREQFAFQERPQPGNCFYLGLSPNEPLQGNVLKLTIEGKPAASTGINPNRPPRRWEAWDGKSWQPVLWHETHDETRGFSFDAPGRHDHLLQKKADVMLHLPLEFPAKTLGDYHACWVRCLYQPSSSSTAANGQTVRDEMEYDYSRAPEFTGLSVRAIGGTVPASQCQRIDDELLGESTGKPGQTFKLQTGSILPCHPEREHILVEPPGEPPQIWQEVSDFADSGPSDRHYTLDAVTGQIQFGPLIREPSKLRADVQVRRQVQLNSAQLTQHPVYNVESLERQYGAVPPRGAIIRMSSYRTGGGQKGNVQKEEICIRKSAVPYVKQVINYQVARGGADAESLDEAVIRVPHWLRTRNRAVTPEDFETLTRQASSAVARTFCSGQPSAEGMVEVFVVPRIETDETTQLQGLAPHQLRLSEPMEAEILNYLKPRQLLGIGIKLREPEYTGVSVQVEVGLDPHYETPLARQQIVRDLLTQLYRFLNPLIGGLNGQGWSMGLPVYKSDIVSLVQKTAGVRYLGTVQLFSLKRNGNGWNRVLSTDDRVHPGESGLICSWQDAEARTGHVITLLERNGG